MLDSHCYRVRVFVRVRVCSRVPRLKNGISVLRSGSLSGFSLTVTVLHEPEQILIVVFGGSLHR